MVYEPFAVIEARLDDAGAEHLVQRLSDLLALEAALDEIVAVDLQIGQRQRRVLLDEFPLHVEKPRLGRLAL